MKTYFAMLEGGNSNNNVGMPPGGGPGFAKNWNDLGLDLLLPKGLEIQFSQTYLNTAQSESLFVINYYQNPDAPLRLSAEWSDDNYWNPNNDMNEAKDNRAENFRRQLSHSNNPPTGFVIIYAAQFSFLDSAKKELNIDEFVNIAFGDKTPSPKLPNSKYERFKGEIYRKNTTLKNDVYIRLISGIIKRADLTPVTKSVTNKKQKNRTTVKTKKTKR